MVTMRMENVCLLALSFGSLAFIVFINIAVFLWRAGLWDAPGLISLTAIWLAILALGWTWLIIRASKRRNFQDELEKTAEHELGMGWANPSGEKIKGVKIR